jgi:hypothetical protein
MGMRTVSIQQWIYYSNIIIIHWWVLLNTNKRKISKIHSLVYNWWDSPYNPVRIERRKKKFIRLCISYPSFIIIVVWPRSILLSIFQANLSVHWIAFSRVYINAVTHIELSMPLVHMFQYRSLFLSPVSF